jgi:hypothetical protein
MSEIKKDDLDQIQLSIGRGDEHSLSEETKIHQSPKEPEWANPFNWLIAALMIGQFAMFIEWLAVF